uniref:Uncharacterized protein n=1 Tax=viral metagenome TaxID=1070528 RepID=A0A6C0DUZ0_9ZZZZ
MSNTNNLDLDINNYTLKDLEQFFSLRPNSKYTAADIENREYELREQLLKSGHINKRFKRDLIEFLEKAKQWLTHVKCPKEKEPSVVPKNYKLDTYDVPSSTNSMSRPYSRNEDLIERPVTQFVYSQNSEFFPGTLNPLSNRVITRCLNIDSRFRENLFATQASDYTVHLPNKIGKVVSMQLASIELPITFYGISAGYGNNFLYLAVNYNNAINPTGPTIDVTKIVTIPDGNYNAIDLVEKLNVLISGPDASGTIFSNILVSLDITTSGSGSGKITIGANPPSIVNYITLDFYKNIHGDDDNVPPATKLGWNLGFIYPFYTNAKSYTADSVVEPSSIRYLYLIVDDFNKNANNHFIGVLNNSIFSPNILAKITMKGSYYSILMETDYNIVTEPRIYFGPVDIQKLKIQLVDETGRVLSMNNADFSFSIILKMLYDL